MAKDSTVEARVSAKGTAKDIIKAEIPTRALTGPARTITMAQAATMAKVQASLECTQTSTEDTRIRIVRLVTEMNRGQTHKETERWNIEAARDLPAQGIGPSSLWAVRSIIFLNGEILSLREAGSDLVMSEKSQDLWLPR